MQNIKVIKENIKKHCRQNDGLIIISIISLILSGLLTFVAKDYSVYDRSIGVFEGMLGLIIASYAIFISFIEKLKKKLDDTEVLSMLNYYFIINIALLFLINIFYVIYPLLGVEDSYWFRLLYFLTIGVTLLIIYYLFFAAKYFIKAK